MIYELFGIPGCGKTTCCNDITEKFNYDSPMKFYKENFIGKIIFHLFLKFFKLNKNLRNKYAEILEIVGKNNNYTNCMNDNIRVELYLKYMIFVYYIEEKNSKDIIIDEGIIHYCIALYSEFEVEFEKLDKIIECLKISNVKKVINIKCSAEEALINIKKRNRKNTAIDFLEENDLKKMLNKYFEGSQYYSNKYVSLSISEIRDEVGKYCK